MTLQPDAFLVQFLANVFNVGVIVPLGSRTHSGVINFIVLCLTQQKLKYRTQQTTDVELLSHSHHNQTICHTISKKENTHLVNQRMKGLTENP